LYVIHVADDGTYDYKKLLDAYNNEVPFMVANGIRTANSIIFLGRKGSKKQLLKISF
jgi:hypothetical protein